ncbi:MAG: hypothetical protein ICV73_20660 [Acetobacteraceae bacterium]|nr:hypothetical protein [Acetobacteraceae bacterium]
MSDGDDPSAKGKKRLRYSVSLMISHPHLKRAEMTRALGVTPMYGWDAGEPRRTPAGTPQPGNRWNTYWGFSNVTRGKRAFFAGAVGMLERLEKAADFIRGITDSGGKISITVGLYGGQNIGDAIGWSELVRFAALEVELGVEVFPTMQKRW